MAPPLFTWARNLFAGNSPITIEQDGTVVVDGESGKPATDVTAVNYTTGGSVTYTPGGAPDGFGMIGVPLGGGSIPWSQTGDLGSDEVIPTEIAPGNGIQFGFDAGVLSIRATAPFAKLADIPIDLPGGTSSNIFGYAYQFLIFTDVLIWLTSPMVGATRIDLKFGTTDGGEDIILSQSITPDTPVNTIIAGIDVSTLGSRFTAGNNYRWMQGSDAFLPIYMGANVVGDAVTAGQVRLLMYGFGLGAG